MATARAMGCSEAASTAPASRSTSARRAPSSGVTSSSSIRPSVIVPGLVEHDRADPARALEDLRPADEDAKLRPPPGADHERRRRRQAERAWAGDDQHRDGRGEGGRRRRAGQEPPGERREREHDHDRHEHRRHAVGQALHGRLAGLGLVDEGGDAGKRRVGADTRCAHDQPAVGVQGGARHGAPDGDLDRRGLAGEHRAVDRRRALADDAVGGDLLAGADDEQVADGEVGDRQQELAPVPKHAHLVRSELEQRPDRVARAPLRAGLEDAPEQDQGRHDRGDLEVGIGVQAGDEHDGRPRPGRERAQRDQRLHRGHSVAGAPQRRAVDAPPRVEDDGSREHERRPLPAGEMQPGHHAEERGRDRQHDRHREPAAQERLGLVVMVMAAVVPAAHPHRLGRRRPVPAGLDGADQALDGHVGRAVHRRLLGQVVHAGRDAGHAVQAALDPRRARRAMHPGDRQAPLGARVCVGGLWYGLLHVGKYPWGVS